MIYRMTLNADPFEKMKSGKKTVELRLFDIKRRKIDIGDVIVFTNKNNSSLEIAASVNALHRYATFAELFRSISLEKCGFDSEDTIKEAVTEMSKYYSEETVKLYGVVGIELELVDTEKALQDLKEQLDNEFDRLFPDGMK